MLDSVKVASETFKSVMFMSSAERKEFTQSNVPNDQKPQKKTRDGVPLWSVQVAAVTWRGTSQLLAVTVPSDQDPAQNFETGNAVSLKGLVFGVTPKQNGGFTVWCSADAITPALASVQQPATSRSA